MSLRRQEHAHDPGTRRALILVLDGVGCGEAPDTAAYGDSGSDTIGNVARAAGGGNLPKCGNDEARRHNLPGNLCDERNGVALEHAVGGAVAAADVEVVIA